MVLCCSYKVNGYLYKDICSNDIFNFLCRSIHYFNCVGECSQSRWRNASRYSSPSNSADWRCHSLPSLLSSISDISPYFFDRSWDGMVPFTRAVTTTTTCRWSWSACGEAGTVCNEGRKLNAGTMRHIVRHWEAGKLST